MVAENSDQHNSQWGGDLAGSCDLPERPIVDLLGTSMPALVHPITPNRLISQVMNRFGPTNARVVPRSVARRDEVYSPQGVTGESIRVGGG